MERETEEERVEEEKIRIYRKENRKIDYYILFIDFIINFVKRKSHKVYGSREPNNCRIEFIS